MVLHDKWGWQKPTVSGAAMEVQPVPSDASTGGQVWELQALEAGSATVSAVGTPNCRQGTSGCSDTQRRYSVRFEIAH